MNILLAEDDYHVSYIMQLCLEKIGGHTVTISTDGEEALLALPGKAFDLIILDGMMPKKSGLQVARELKSRGNQIPIIFLSAKNDEKEYLAFGRGYIPKPFDPATICSKIDEILKDLEEPQPDDQSSPETQYDCVHFNCYMLLVWLAKSFDV